MKRQYASNEEIMQWLRANELDLFARGLLVHQGLKECAKKLGKRVPLLRFRICRQDVCEFWTELPMRGFSGKTELNWREWDKFRQFAESNEKLLRRAPSLAFVARVMRARGIVANPQVLRDACSFMAHWKKYHPEEAA